MGPLRVHYEYIPLHWAPDNINLKFTFHQHALVNNSLRVSLVLKGHNIWMFELHPQQFCVYCSHLFLKINSFLLFWSPSSHWAKQQKQIFFLNKGAKNVYFFLFDFDVEINVGSGKTKIWIYILSENLNKMPTFEGSFSVNKMLTFVTPRPVDLARWISEQMMYNQPFCFTPCIRK